MKTTTTTSSIQKASPSSGQYEIKSSSLERRASDIARGSIRQQRNSVASYEGNVANSDKSEESKGPKNLNSELLIPPLNPSNPSEAYQTPNKPKMQEVEGKILQASGFLRQKRANKNQKNQVGSQIFSLETGQFYDCVPDVPRKFKKICKQFYLNDAGKIYAIEDSQLGQVPKFKRLALDSKFIDIALFQTTLLLLNDKGEIYHLNTEVGSHVASKLQSSISQMYISAVSASDNKILFLTSSGFVYETNLLDESPQVVFPLLQVKVVWIECTNFASLAVAQIRLGKDLVVIENQIVTENKLIAYTWSADQDLKVVPQSLNMNIIGALLSQNLPILFTEDNIFINQLQPAKSVIKVDDKICYLGNKDTLKILDGPEYKIASNTESIIQIGPQLLYVQSSEDSPTKADIPNEENHNQLQYQQHKRLPTEVDPNKFKYVARNMLQYNSNLAVEAKIQRPQSSQAVLNQEQISHNTHERGSFLNYVAITSGQGNLSSQKFRPTNLPPQSDEEALRVQMIVERDRKAYLKKKQEIQAKAELLEKEEKEKLKKMDGKIKIWIEEIFPNWDNVKRTKRVRELWIEGLPDQLRGKVWFLAFGNRSAITKDLFEIMAERGQTLTILLKKHSQLEQKIIENGGLPPQKQIMKINDDDLVEKSEVVVQLTQKLMRLRKKLAMLIPLIPQLKSKERSILIIETDVPRTFAHIDTITSEHRVILKKILQAFTMYRPDIGYVQGMSYVASMLLIHTQDELMTFVTFCNLMTKYPILPFYNFNDVLIRKIMQLYKQVFAYNLPELCEHFELEGVQPRQYIFEWFMTLFTRVFKDLTLTRRIWDFYFLDGIFVLFQTAIAILRLLSETVPELWGEMEDILPTLQNAGSEIQKKVGQQEVQQLLTKYMYDVSFPKWVYDEIPLLESEFFKQDLTFN